MSSPRSPERTLPEDPRLAQIARELERARGASFLCDSTVTLVWVSEELRKLLGDPSDQELAIGKHIVEAYMSGVWASAITLESQMRAFLEEFPMCMTDTPGGKEGLKEIFIRALPEWDKAVEFGPTPAEKVPEVVDTLFEGLEPVDPRRRFNLSF